MPFYADLSSLYGIPSSSYSAPYLSGPYSGHSSLISTSSFSRPSSSYGKSRGFTTSRNYKPHLATISETQIASRSVLPRINPPSLLLPSSTAFAAPRPVFINTADIDVSVNKYRKFERTVAAKPQLPYKKPDIVTKITPPPPPPPVIMEPQVEESGSPFMPRIDNADTRRTIKRERTVVRIHTDHAQGNHGTNKPKESNVLLLKPRWRENFDPGELSGREKKQPVKTPGAKLMEKFLIKDTIKEEQEDKIIGEQEERKRMREENLKMYDEGTKKTRKSVKRKQSVKKTPSFHDICRSISSDQINEDLNPVHTMLEQRRNSKMYCDEETLKEIRRNSAEILQEQVLMLDEILRQQNETDSSKTDEASVKPKEETEKRKKKIVKKKSNEKITLAADDEEEIKATSLQRRPPVKKRRSSTASSLDSVIEDLYDKDKEKSYQDAIRDTSQPEVDKIEVKTKDEEGKPKRKTAISYTLEEAEQKRKSFAKKQESSSQEENEDAAVLKRNLQNMLLANDAKHLKSKVDTGVIQNAKPKEVVTSSVLQKQPAVPKKGQVLLEKAAPARPKKPTSKEVNNNDVTLTSKSKSGDAKTLSKVVEKHGDEEVDFWSSINPEENAQKLREHMKAEQERLQALKWEQEVQKLAEQERAQEEEAKRKLKEAEEEQKRKLKLEEEEKRKQKLAEEERKRKQKLAEEEEKKKRKLAEEEERKRKEAEAKRLQKLKEEEERKKKEAEEKRLQKLKEEEEKRLKKQKDEEELKRRRAELEAQKKKLAEETERRKKRLAEEEEMRKRKETEAEEKRRLKAEEEEKRRLEIEEANRRKEEESMKLEEEKRKAEEEKRRLEEENCRIEEEKRRKIEEEEKRKKEEEKRKIEEEKRRKLEEEKRKKEEERRRKAEEEEKCRKEEEKRKKEEERRKKAEEELKRKQKQKEEEERKLKEKLLHEEKVKRRKLQEELEKQKLLEEARKRREKEAEEARLRREREAEEARLRREREAEEERKKLEEEAARIKAEYEENLRVKEAMARKMASKRSIVTKYNTVEDPDLEVFQEPETEETEDESAASGGDASGFVPLQSNQFMLPFQKPEQYQECPVTIMATPKPIRTRHYPKPRVPHLPATAQPPPAQNAEEDEDDDEEDDDDTSSADEESSEEEEYALERSGADIGKSTSSTDSGFDSSAPGSPANRRHNG